MLFVLCKSGTWPDVVWLNKDLFVSTILQCYPYYFVLIIKSHYISLVDLKHLTPAVYNTSQWNTWPVNCRGSAKLIYVVDTHGKTWSTASGDGHTHLKNAPILNNVNKVQKLFLFCILAHSFYSTTKNQPSPGESLHVEACWYRQESHISILAPAGEVRWAYQ